MGYCLAVSSSCRGLVVAVNLSVCGGRVLSLLRVVDPVVRVFWFLVFFVVSVYVFFFCLILRFSGP